MNKCVMDFRNVVGPNTTRAGDILAITGEVTSTFPNGAVEVRLKNGDTIILRRENAKKQNRRTWADRVIRKYRVAVNPA